MLQKLEPTGSPVGVPKRQAIRRNEQAKSRSGEQAIFHGIFNVRSNIG
ncbi:MAG: hypothetical protein K0B08_04625 [Bacteroidales bacterium]|nr:hypothetical protein [Bacteroidales bacterium]